MCYPSYDATVEVGFEYQPLMGVPAGKIVLLWVYSTIPARRRNHGETSET